MIQEGLVFSLIFVFGKRIGSFVAEKEKVSHGWWLLLFATSRSAIEFAATAAATVIRRGIIGLAGRHGRRSCIYLGRNV
jgi:hypothetical protein